MEQTENPFFEPEIVTKPRSTVIVDMLQSVVVALFIAILLYVFVLTPNQIDGYSMCPNFDDGQLVLTNKVSQWLGQTPFGQSLGLDYSVGDMVVFQKPDKDKPLIKRVIGVAGDRIGVKDGHVFVNGQRLEENYLPSERRTGGGTYLGEGEEITVEEGSYFLMGDNRGNSLDSRFTDVGQVKREWLQGKVILRYLPLDTFSIISGGGETPGTFCPAEVQ